MTAFARRPKGRPAALALALALLARAAHASEVPLALASTEAIRTDGRGGFEVRLSRPPEETDGRLAVLVRMPASRDVLDLTDLASGAGDALSVDLSLAPLVAGRYTVEVVLQPVMGPARTVGRVALLVELPAEAKVELHAGSFVFRPTLDVGAKAQLRESVSGGARASPRPTYADATLQGSFEASGQGDEWGASARLNFAGSSYRAEAITFGTRGDGAPKLDVLDFLADVAWRDTRLTGGQITVTPHPLLYANVSNRGLSFAQRLPLDLEFWGVAQSSTSLQGTANFFGIAEPDTRYRSFGLGYDFDKANPGATRLEFTRFEGRNNTTLYSGLRDEQESRGDGVRFLWRNASGTVRTETSYAVSEHRASLPEGGIAREEGRAFAAEGGYDFVRDLALAGQPLNLSIGARLEYASPFYRSLGSTLASNYRTTSEAFNIQWGSAFAQVAAIQRLDNVDEDPRYMRNRVSGWMLNATLPPDWLESLYRVAFASPAPAPAPGTRAPRPVRSPWIPAISVSSNTYDSYGDPNLVPEGYTQDDLPRVVSASHAAGLDWTFPLGRFSWKLMRVSEKNRQPGEEGHSSSRVKQGFAIDLRPTRDISVSFGTDFDDGDRRDTPVHQLNSLVRARASWRINLDNDLSMDFTRARDYDDPFSRSNTTRRAQAQWITRFTLPVLGYLPRLPVQAYVRILGNDARLVDPRLPEGAVVAPRTVQFQVGATVSLF